MTHKKNLGTSLRCASFSQEEHEKLCRCLTYLDITFFLIYILNDNVMVELFRGFSESE